MTTCRVELIEWKEFAAAILGKNNEAFVVHVASLAVGIEMTIQPSQMAEIASLITHKTPIIVFVEYSDFADIFLPESAAELPEYTRINDHSIELIDNWQPPYEPIYSLGPVEMKTLKTYIEVNLANGFIRLFKFPAEAPSCLFDSLMVASIARYIRIIALAGILCVSGFFVHIYYLT